MKAFRYLAGELYCEQVPLRRLVERYGAPLYVYSHAHFIGQLRQLDAAFRGLDHLICFAVKSNSNLSVIHTLARAGAGFDTVSGGELRRVVEAGGDPHRCVFAGVGKTSPEIEYALRLGINCFNVESEPEMEVIAAIARRLRRRAPIALRVNPGVDPHTHYYVSTGKHESKFGIPIARALEVYQEARRFPSLEIRGVQMHIGSQITSTTPFVQAIKKILPLVEKVRALAPDTLQFFDIGGGLGIRYHNERPPTAAEFAAIVRPLVGNLGLKILLEPGRFIVGNGGTLVTRVLYVKRTAVKRFVITDAAMNDLIRPVWYGSYHEIVPVVASRRKSMTADIVGGVCESGDFFAQGRRIPEVRAGELLAIMSAGAYGMTMASNYNSRPRPAEVLVSGRRAALARPREKIEDLIDSEKIAAWLR